MLVELVVHDLGVIEKASMLLESGVTALTGETGAGKTLVTEAIGLLAGGRADPNFVRAGASEAVVEGRFVGSDGEERVARRVVPASGRSRAYLDGAMATASALAEVIGPLVEVHGQHGQQHLLQAASRRDALDRFGNHDASVLTGIRRELAEAEAALAALGGDEMARAREMDLLEFQVDEIDAAGISSPDEDARLAERELVLGDAAAHQQAAQQLLALLSVDGEVGSGIAEAISAIGDRTPFAAIAERLHAIQADLMDLVDEVRNVDSTLENDPEALAELQSRREVLTGLRRKYGRDLAAVLAFQAETAERLTELRNHETRAEALQQQLSELTEREQVAADRLAADRRATAPKLASAVEAELRRLALPKASVEVIAEGHAGADVDFLVSLNPGAPRLPLAKVASGGELSRIMLALQFVLGSESDTVIYDEVDAGVGGQAATSIGRALAGVGRHHQVLVVTHLPQVAACADQQVNIVKQAAGGSTRTELHRLDHDGRIIELARMLSGSPDSDNARAHAAELLAEAAQ